MTEATMNGPADGSKFIDTVDPDDPEYQRQLRRPAEVKQDVQQMEDRSRVNQILKTKAFREELEEIVHDQIKQGPHPASLLALQQISELLLPHSRGSSGSFGRLASTAIPIADIRGVDSLNYTKGEKMLRCKLAAAYRLIEVFGFATFNSFVTTRISQEYEHFLVMPYGMLYTEVTASSLVKVTLQGEVVDAGSTAMGINKTGFGLHAAIHAARPDLKTLIHIKCPAAVAVSCMNQGLLPISQEALAIGEPSYFTDYTGCVSDQEESDKLVRCLGPRHRVLILRNHGVIVGGDTIEDAVHTTNFVMTAIDIQLRTLPVGVDNIVQPSEEVRKKAYQLANEAPSGEGARKWRRGELEFEAYMRHLDNAGYRTGHMYREPFMRRQDRRDRTNSDVEIPPTSSSVGQYYEEGYGSPLKQHFDKQKKVFKSEWLNSPNAYKKEEFDEKGTAHPKKITRWVSETEEGGGANVKVDSPNVFAPQGGNPKELKEKYKEIRKEYYDDHIDSGPQSKILEGMSWEEAQRIKDGHVSGTSDGMIVVGAASKGIIQRDHQHNAVVYKTYYAPNPFDNMTEEEIDKYKREVASQGQAAGDAENLEPGPDGRLISSEERMQTVKDGGVVTTTKTTTIQVSTQPAPSSKEPSSPEALDLQRSQSARLPPEQGKQLVQELQDTNFGRSKSDRKPKKKKHVNGDQPQTGSPTKSTSSGEATLEEGSPTRDVPAEQESPSKEGKKKKKRGFRIPSFSKKKEGKEAKEAAK